MSEDVKKIIELIKKELCQQIPLAEKKKIVDDFFNIANNHPNSILKNPGDYKEVLYHDDEKTLHLVLEKSVELVIWYEHYTIGGKRLRNTSFMKTIGKEFIQIKHKRIKSFRGMEYFMFLKTE